MTYELSKKLKDAGFHKHQFCYYDFYKIKKFPFFKFEIKPNLSELINACGYKFYRLICLDKDNWVAEAIIDEIKTIKSLGETPEEAVANLYLKLKKVS